MCLRATIPRPLRSKRLMISPVSPRAKASGLTRMRVRSDAMSRHIYRLSPLRRLLRRLRGDVRATLRVADDEPDERDQGAAEGHLDQRDPQRDLLVALADPGDDQQLRPDHRIGDGKR